MCFLQQFNVVKKIGKVKRGGSSKTWDGEIAEILEEKGILLREAKELANDKDQLEKIDVKGLK